jgi:hypothetical protein
VVVGLHNGVTVILDLIAAVVALASAIGALWWLSVLGSLDVVAVTIWTVITRDVVRISWPRRSTRGRVKGADVRLIADTQPSRNEPLPPHGAAPFCLEAAAMPWESRRRLPAAAPA